MRVFTEAACPLPPPGPPPGAPGNPDWLDNSAADFNQFAVSVARAGDLNADGFDDIIVGARDYDFGVNTAGAAFVYFGSSAGLSSTPDWMAHSGGATSSQFGLPVSTAGDVNGDGYADIIVGARHYTNDQAFEGSAFIWHGTSTGVWTTAGENATGTPANAMWTAEGDQTAPFSSQASNFGHVASAGDVNGDGFGDVVVGAHSFDNPENGEGAVFLWLGSANGMNGGSPGHVGTSTNGNFAWMFDSDDVSGRAGYPVGSAGDVNGDGYDDVVVGADSYSPSSSAGAAFMFYGNSSPVGLSLTPDWTGGIGESLGGYGNQVGSAGDVNGDNYDDFFVLASTYVSTSTGVTGGRIYVYHGSPTGASTTPDWIATGEFQGKFSGIGVNGMGTADDMNGDGYSELVAGQPMAGPPFPRLGRFLVWFGGVGGLRQSVSGTSLVAQWIVEGDQADAQFAAASSAAGDVNGDNCDDLLIGAPFYDTPPNTNDGMVFLYFGSSTPGSACRTSAFAALMSTAEASAGTAAALVPSIGEWGLAALAPSFGGFVVFKLRRRVGSESG